MSNSKFERLEESLVEMGEVIRGNETPSREFVYRIKAGNITDNSSEMWGVFVGDDEDLTPMKIYRLRQIYKNRATVTDNAGAAVVCSLDDFVIVEVENSVQEVFARFAA